jgi:pimeloyl-ACP methyl ester carboxylesterase
MGKRFGAAVRAVVVLSFVLQLGFVPAPASAQPAGTGARFVRAGATFQSASALEVAHRRCPKTGPIGETEGETYACGTLLVPENYDDPDGRQIALTFELFQSWSLSPAPDPVIYLEGGPGGSAVDSGAVWATMFGNLRKTRDIVIFDQRGTKYSGRLDCGPYSVALNYLIQTDPETQEIFAQITEEGGDTAFKAAQTEVYYSACASGLVDNGVDLSQYNSAVSAHDIESLADALGYEEFNLFGISYGTRLALTMMRDRPDNIRSVVLDSTLPPQVDFFESLPTFLDTVVTRIITNCEAQRRCARAFPGLDERLDQVLERVATDEFAIGLLVAVLTQVNTDGRVAQYIPRMIYELSEGSSETMEGIISGEIFETESDELPELSEAQEMMLTAQELEKDAVDILAAAAEQEQANRPGALWFNALATAIARIPDEEDRVYALMGMLIIPGLSATPDRDLLTQLVEELISDDDQEALLNGLGALEDDEVQFVFDLIADVSEGITQMSLTDGMYYAVHCREELPFNSKREAREVIEALRFPDLAFDAEARMEQYFAVCAAFPTGEAADKETQLVESDIPTLVLAGEYDTQTPLAWGKAATEELTNVYEVEFPNSGHGTILFSQCARDIGEAFINSPDHAPLTTCTDGLTTQFVVTTS